jgi:hypothetical protein
MSIVSLSPLFPFIISFVSMAAAASNGSSTGSGTDFVSDAASALKAL